jgi:hypothetical protein
VVPELEVQNTHDQGDAQSVVMGNRFSKAVDDPIDDALTTLFRQRYTEQIEVADAAAIMERWES